MPGTIIREQATTSALQRALGPHYNEVVIYDYENNKLLTETYNAQKVTWDDYCNRGTKEFKNWFDKEFKNDKLTLVCNVSKQVSITAYPGWFAWTQSTKDIRMAKRGTYTVCNFVVRDETTGKLQLLSNTAWLTIWIHSTPTHAARDGAFCVADFGTWNPDFRRAIAEQCKRMKAAGK